MSKKIKKTKVKINAFDVFVMLLVLCLIATVAYKVYTSISSDNNTKNSYVTMTFKCDGEYSSILDYLSEGEAVYLESGEILGYIHKNPDNEELFTITEHIGDVAGGTRAVTTKAVYEKIQFTGEIKLNGNAVKSQKGTYYTIDDENITVGGKILLHTKNAEFTVTVTGFNEVDKY